jgi:hypothetical protein
VPLSLTSTDTLFLSRDLPKVYLVLIVFFVIFFVPIISSLPPINLSFSKFVVDICYTRKERREENEKIHLLASIAR